MSAIYSITAVFLDGTTPTDGSEPLLPFAQDLEVPQWTDGTLSIVAVGSDGEAYDISGGAFIFTARTRNQAAPPVISHEGDIDDGAAGLAHVDIGSVDVGIDVQTLAWSLAFVDSDGKVWASTAQGSFAIVAAEYIPGQNVTVPESQQPLAQGQGFTWRSVYAGGTTYAPYDVVSFDDTGVVSSYVCILASTGHDPTNATYWDLMASGAA